MFRKLSSIALVLSCLFNGVNGKAALIGEENFDDETEIVSEEENTKNTRSEETGETEGDITVNKDEKEPAEAEEPATGVLTVIALDSEGNSLSDVGYSVIDSESNMCAMWSSGEEEYSVSLAEGEYTLTERSVPEGLDRTGITVFSINENETTIIRKQYFQSGSTFIGETLNEGATEVEHVVFEEELQAGDGNSNTVVEKVPEIVTSKDVQDGKAVLSKGPSTVSTLNVNSVNITLPEGDPVYTGTSGSCPWNIYSDGTLVIGENETSCTLGEGNVSSSSGWKSYKAAVTSLVFAGDVHTGSNAEELFYTMTSLVSADLTNLDDSAATSMYRLLGGCSKLTSVVVPESFGQGSANMRDMFNAATILPSISLPEGFGSNATSVEGMFYGCKALKTLSLPERFGKEAVSVRGIVYECNNLESITIPEGCGAKATTCVNMFRNCSKLTSVVLPTGFGALAQDTNYMFNGCSAITSITLPEGFGANTTVMNNMFENCKKLGSLTLPEGFGSKATNMAKLFYNCNALASINIPAGFGTAATDMSYMFASCNNLASPIVFSEGTGSKATAMNNMFADCNKIPSVTLPDNFGIKTTNMERMFNNMYALESIILPAGFGSAATSIAYLFSGDRLLENVTMPAGFGSVATNMSYMINGCPVLTELVLPDHFGEKATNLQCFVMNDYLLASIRFPEGFGLKATNLQSTFQGTGFTELQLPAGFGSLATNTSRTFNDCEKLETMILPAGFGSRSQNMQYMFEKCYKLDGIQFPENFGSAGTNMQYMFTSCTSLSELEFPTGFGQNNQNYTQFCAGCTSLESVTMPAGSGAKATNASSMFTNCYKLSYLDLSGFDTAKVTNMSNLLTNNESLATLKLSDNMGGNTGSRFADSNLPNIVLARHTEASDGTPTGDDTVYSGAEMKAMSISQLGGTWEFIISATLIKGPDFNKAIKTLSGQTNPGYGTDNKLITAFVRSYTAPAEGVVTADISSRNIGTIVAWYDNGTIYWYSPAQTVYMNADSSQMFRQLSALPSVDVSEFNTSGVTSMNSMFYNCSSLRSLDLSNFDTSAVNNMESMFFLCNFLSELKLSDKMGGNTGTRFASAALPSVLALKHTLYADGTATGDDTVYTNREIMAMSESDLAGTWKKANTTLTDGVSFNVAVKELSGQSNANRNTVNSTITEIKRSANPPATGVITADISSIGDGSVVAWYDNGTIYWYSTYEKVYLNSNSSWMFQNLTALTSVDLSEFDSSAVTNLYGSFNGCSSLRTLDLSGNNLSAVTNMTVTFSGDKIYTLVFPDTMAIAPRDSDLSTQIKYQHVSNSAGEPTGDETLYTGVQVRNLSGSELGGTWQSPIYTVTYDVTNRGIGTVPDQTRHNDTSDVITITDIVPRGRGSSYMNTLYFIGDYDEVEYEEADYGNTTTVTFTNWLGSDGKTYVAGNKYSADADITLTAQYETVSTDYKLTLPSAEKEGYVLTGWYTPNGDYVGTAGDEIMPTGLYEYLEAGFEEASKTMTLSNTVSGNLASRDKEFTYYVGFDDGTNGSVDISGVEYWKNGVQQTVTTDEGDIVITMAHGDTVELRNVPAGAYWTIAQLNYSSEGYSTSYRIGSGESVDGTVVTGELTDDTSVSFSNVRSTTVPTEIRTDTPIVGLCVAGLAVILLGLYFARKRLITGD